MRRGSSLQRKFSFSYIAIIAAVLITWINSMLQNMLSGDLAAIKLLVYALILIVIVLFNNAPALQKYKEKISPHHIKERLLAPRRKPGTITDDAAAWNRIPTKIPMDETLSVDLRLEEALPAQNEDGKEGTDHE